MNEMISIIRIAGPDYQKKLVAKVPLADGEFETSQGLLKIQMGEVRKSDKHQKVIFSGSVMPTIQQRGDGRFLNPPQYPRRVVNLPPSYKSEVVQQVGQKEELIFQRRQNER